VVHWMFLTIVTSQQAKCCLTDMACTGDSKQPLKTFYPLANHSAMCHIIAS
jgi:hypothetical protein